MALDTFLLTNIVLSGSVGVVTVEQVANQSFGYGLLSADQAGAFTVIPTSGTITSIVIDGASLGSASDFETTGTTIRTSVGNTFSSNTTLNCTATFADTSTDTFDAIITADANEYSVASDAEYRTVLAIATATLSGKTLRIRDGVTITPVDADYLTRVFSSVFTIAAYPSATVTIDDQMKLDTVTKMTVDGGPATELRLKFVAPEVDFQKALEIDTCTDIIVEGCEFSSAFGTIDPDGDYRPRLDYTTETGTFTVGQIVTGGTSGKTVEIVGLVDNGTTGTLILDGADSDINSSGEEFTSGEALTDPLGGAAVVDVGNPTLYQATTLPKKSSACGTTSGVITTNITFKHNYVHDLHTGAAFHNVGTLDIIGNHFSGTYTDALNVNRNSTGDATIDIDQNVFDGAIANSKDLRNPHVDSIQFLDASGTGVWPGGRITMNRVLDTHNNSLFGIGNTQGIFANNGPTKAMNGWLIEGNMLCTSANHGLSIDEIEDSLIGFNTLVKQEGASTGSPSIKMDDTGSTQAGCLLYDNLADNVVSGSTSTEISNNEMGVLGASLSPTGTYADLFPGDGGGGFQPTTVAQLVTYFTPDSGTDGALEVATFATTIPGSDGTLDETKRPAPSVLTFAPADGAADQAVTTDPVVTFNQPVVFGTGNVTVFDASDDSVIEAFDVATEEGTGAGQIEVSGAVVTLHMTADFTGGLNVYIQIDATAIDASLSTKSYAGIADKTTWNFGIVATSAFSVTFAGSAIDTTTQTTYTFTSVPFSTADANREVFVAATSRGAALRTVSSMTIGGVSATLVTDGTTNAISSRGFSGIEWWRASVATGTTGTVEVILDADSTRAGIQIFAVYNRTVGNVDDVANADAASSTTGPSLTVDVEADGTIVAGLTHTVNSLTPTWTGVDQDNAEIIEGDINQRACSRDYVSQTIGQTVSVTWNSAANNQALTVFTVS